MDFESLLTATKWELLQQIAYTPQSPLQLAHKLDTTIANVSIQLRLLEAAGFVTKTKTGEAKAGKPRFLYTIQQDQAHITAIAKGLAFKQLQPISIIQKTQIALWQTDQEVQLPLLKFFIDHRDLLDHDVYITNTTNITCTVCSKGTKQTYKILIDTKSHSITLNYTANYKPKEHDIQVCFGGVHA